MLGKVERRLLSAARYGCLATLAPDGLPHLVPIVFAVHGDIVYIPVDSKPKRSRRLQRIRNLERNPNASILVFNWEEDWTQLWWIRLHGGYRALTDPIELGMARRLLLGKYPAYREPSELDPVFAIDITAARSWSANTLDRGVDPRRDV
jgi:PPOX class probable F420-dependent enzyme